VWEVERAYDQGDIELHAPIELRIPELEDVEASNGHKAYVKTTAGRVFFNQALPSDFRFINDIVGKKTTTIGEIVQELADSWPKAIVAESVDQIKNNAFRYATQSGVTFSIDGRAHAAGQEDDPRPLREGSEKIETQFKRGIITDGERRQKEVEIWTSATSEVEASMARVMDENQFNPIQMMVNSGARGNVLQIRQIAGMRGLVANPRGDMIPRPIKSNFREGLAMLEYFIATPGARKGLVDTALRTADSGYLTRRLVDVRQELIIREDRLRGTTRGVWIEDVGADTPAGARTSRPASTARARQRRDARRRHGARGRAQLTTRRSRRCATTPTSPACGRAPSLTCDAEQGVCGSATAVARHGGGDRAR
jgi:DNA-directed RNA polymerase subunit beta'